MLTIHDLSILLGRPAKDLIKLIKSNFKGTERLELDSVLDSRWTHFLVRQSERRWPQFQVVTIAALKGGIGKTTLTLNMAKLAAGLGLKVVVVDFDPEACATNALRISGNGADSLILCDIFREGREISEAICRTNIPGVDLVPSALRNHHLEKVVGHQNPKKIVKGVLEGLRSYNLVFLDLPPAFSTITGSAYLACDLIVLPCTPNIFSLESVALTIEAIDKLADEFECKDLRYKILMNQYSQQRVAAREVFALLDERYGEKLCPYPVRESADVVNATNSGATVFDIRIAQGVRDSFTRLGSTILGW
jgi:chromosome partitioning protein